MNRHENLKSESIARESRTDGFTLIEILIAITILGMIMATVLGTFTGIMSSTREAESKAEIYQTGRALMDLIVSDIRCIYRHDVEGLGPFFIGDAEWVGGRTMSKMEFLTTNTLSAGLGKNPFFSEAGYRVKKNEDDGLCSLWRRSQSPPEFPYGEGGREIPLCRIMENFRLEFLQDSDKRESLLYSIPDSVVIDFTLNQSGKRERFVTMVRPMIDG